MIHSIDPRQNRLFDPFEGSEFRVLAFLGGDEVGYHKFLFDIVLSSPRSLCCYGRRRFFGSGVGEAPLGRLGVAIAALHDRTIPGWKISGHNNADAATSGI